MKPKTCLALAAAVLLAGCTYKGGERKFAGGGVTCSSGPSEVEIDKSFLDAFGTGSTSIFVNPANNGEFKKGDEGDLTTLIQECSKFLDGAGL